MNLNLNLSSAVRTAKSVITANSPVLLVGAAITGVVATGVLAAKGGYKARGIVDSAREEAGGVEPTPMEKVKLTWLCYAAPAVTGVSAIASVLGVHTIHSKRHAALAGLYAVTTAKLDDYREQAEELLGPKKTQQLNDSIAQSSADRVNSTTKPGEHEVVVTAGGTELCYDEWGGRYFLGSVPIIERAFDLINLQLVENGEVNLNEFYDHLGLTPVQAGADMGWSGKKITPRFGTVQAPDGRAAIAFWFQQEPKSISRR